MPMATNNNPNFANASQGRSASKGLACSIVLDTLSSPNPYTASRQGRFATCPYRPYLFEKPSPVVLPVRGSPGMKTICCFPKKNLTIDSEEIYVSPQQVRGDSSYGATYHKERV